MKEQTLDILLVEDNEKHLEDAKKEVEKLQLEGISLNVTYATNYLEAKEALETKTYDGILTDIFFPFSEEKENDSELTKICEEVFKETFTEALLPKYYVEYCEDLKKEEWIEGKELAPYGVVIAEDNKDTPLVFCTDTYHHGHKTANTHFYAKKNNMPLVDTEGFHEYEGSADKKDFNIALKVLVELIESKGMTFKSSDEMYQYKEEILIPKFGKDVAGKINIYSRLEEQ